MKFKVNVGHSEEKKGCPVFEVFGFRSIRFRSFTVSKYTVSKFFSEKLRKRITSKTYKKNFETVLVPQFLKF